MRERASIAAVDLGASSGRVVHADIGADGATLREVHRFPNRAVRVGATLHWDVLGLYDGALTGVRKAHDRAGRIDSIGVDGWAVDYGLLSADGRLLANPVCYRDERNVAAARTTVERVGNALYDSTGIQFQPFNTVFQLVAEQAAPLLAGAHRLALIPDLLTYWLTDVLGTELTNASTTGLLDTRTLDWHDGLARRVGVDLGLFPPLRRPGEVVGPVTDRVRAEHGLAAAVAGIPSAGDRFAFVCTGTWALVGVTTGRPVITAESRAANFTNEVAADGTIRLLRNVTGFWLLQECQRQWSSDGVAADSAALVAAAADVPAFRAIIDVQDPSLLAPGDMPRRIVELAARHGAREIAAPAEITRCILDSLALAIRRAVHEASALAGYQPDVVHLVGGGVHNALFCQLVADATGRTVEAGPGEAAAWGNALWQAVALGVIEPSAGRELVRRGESVTTYRPASDEEPWQRAQELLDARASAAP